MKLSGVVLGVVVAASSPVVTHAQEAAPTPPDTLRFMLALEPPEDSALVATRAASRGLRVLGAKYDIMVLVITRDSLRSRTSDLLAFLRDSILRTDGSNAVQRGSVSWDEKTDAPETVDGPAAFLPSWGQDSSRVARPWANGVNGAGVLVGIWDTGFETNHPEFAGRIVGCVSIRSMVVDSTPGACREVNAACNQHGTHVAGTTGGSTVGIASGVRFLFANGYSASGSCGNYPSDRAVGYYWFRDHGAQVVNVSTGGSGILPEITRVAELASQGVIVCAAAGNSGSTSLFTPARLPAAFGIGSLMQWGGMQWASYSNADSTLDFAFPGDGIYSAYYMGYGTKSGTSMAAPHCSGLAALVRQVAPSISRDSVYALFKAAAKDLGPAGRDDRTGWGIPRADRAVALALGLSGPTSTAGTLTFVGLGTQCAAVDSPVEWTLSSAPGLTITREPNRVCITNTDPTPRTVPLTLMGVP